MTKIRGAVSGTHPLGEELIRAILDYKYNRATKDPVKKLFHSELNDLISFQKELGFPLISTGNLGIEDLIRPFTRSLPSLHSYDELGDLPIVRYHYTNTFYRQPTLVSRFPIESSVVSTDIHTLTDEQVYHHQYTENTDARIILPGPYSFLKLINKDSKSPYEQDDDLLSDITQFLINEVQHLPEQYKEIQFDEPYLVWERVSRLDRPAIRSSYEALVKNSGNKTIVVNTYFESAEDVLPFLLDLPIHGIGVDLYKTNIIKIGDYDFDGKILQAGILDAQNYIPQSDGSLSTKDTVFKADIISTLQNLNPKEIIVAPTTGLEYLPKEIADQKLKQISSIITLVEDN